MRTSGDLGACARAAEARSSTAWSVLTSPRRSPAIELAIRTVSRTSPASSAIWHDLIASATFPAASCDRGQDVGVLGPLRGDPLGQLPGVVLLAELDQEVLERQGEPLAVGVGLGLVVGGLDHAEGVVGLAGGGEGPGLAGGEPGGVGLEPLEAFELLGRLGGPLEPAEGLDREGQGGGVGAVHVVGHRGDRPGGLGEVGGGELAGLELGLRQSGPRLDGDRVRGGEVLGERLQRGDGLAPLGLGRRPGQDGGADEPVLGRLDGGGGGGPDQGPGPRPSPTCGRRAVWTGPAPGSGRPGRLGVELQGAAELDLLLLGPAGGVVELGRLAEGRQVVAVPGDGRVVELGGAGDVPGNPAALGRQELGVGPLVAGADHLVDQLVDVAELGVLDAVGDQGDPGARVGRVLRGEESEGRIALAALVQRAEEPGLVDDEAEVVGVVLRHAGDRLLGLLRVVQAEPDGGEDLVEAR